MRKKYNKILSFAASTAAFVSITFASIFAFPEQKAQATMASYQPPAAFETTASLETNSKSSNRYEFEYANRYEQNGQNRIENSTFPGYSGNGYLYLESGWGEVSFSVATSGNYRITIVTNADSYKENFLYLDDNRRIR